MTKTRTIDGRKQKWVYEDPADPDNGKWVDVEEKKKPADTSGKKKKK
jgi:hypothetical protein